MSKLKVIKRNVNPSALDVAKYKAQAGRLHRRAANLRFGKIIAMTDQDLDG